MAAANKKPKPSPPFIVRLRKQVKSKLDEFKVPAEVSIQRIGDTELFRVVVISIKFAKMSHSERQNLVWRLVDDMIPGNKLQITTIMTLTPSESEGKAA